MLTSLDQPTTFTHTLSLYLSLYVLPPEATTRGSDPSDHHSTTTTLSLDHHPHHLPKPRSFLPFQIAAANQEKGGLSNLSLIV